MPESTSSTLEASAEPTVANESTEEAIQPVKRAKKSSSPFATQIEDAKVIVPPTVEAPKYLDTSALGNNLVKVKVDGKEEDVPLADLLKGYQTNAHNTQNAQSNSIQAREFELRSKELELREAEMSARMEALESKFTPAQSLDPQAQPSAYEMMNEDDRWMGEALDPVLKAREEAYNAKMAALEAKVQSLDPYLQALQPQVVENNFKQADLLAQQEGYTDLLESRAKLEEVYMTLDANKQQALQEQGVQGIVALYKDIKLQEYQAQMKKPQPAGVSTESAGGVAPAPSQDAEAKKLYFTALAEARAGAEMGRSNGNFQDVLRMKLGDAL